MPTYELVVYNQNVREFVKNGESHKTFSDDWGDSHYIEFTAPNEAGAVSKCQMKYPEHKGFVIEGVTEV